MFCKITFEVLIVLQFDNVHLLCIIYHCIMSHYFSECFKTYGMPPASSGAPKYLHDTEVMCTSYFSKLYPLENGEVSDDSAVMAIFPVFMKCLWRLSINNSFMIFAF